MASLLVNIDVDDVSTAEAFYTRAFGLRVGRRFGDAGVELLGLDAPLYLLQKAEGSSPFEGAPAARSFAPHWTPVHIDVAVGALEPAVARARGAGATCEGETREAAWGRMQLMRDPFGHGFCLLEFSAAGYDAIATDPPAVPRGLAEYRQMPGAVASAVAGWGEAELDAVEPASQMTGRELVHHILEANVVAASIVLASVGAPGSVYDWSWLFPNRAWTDRMRYASSPVGPALDVLRSLVTYVADLVERTHSLGEVVRLRDTPGGEPRSTTVEDVLSDEVKHVREHLAPWVTSRASDSSPTSSGSGGITPGGEP